MLGATVSVRGDAGCSNVLPAAGGGTLLVEGEMPVGLASFPMGSYVPPRFARGERNYTRER